MAKKKAETTEIEITPEQIAAEQRAIRENRASKAIQNKRYFSILVDVENGILNGGPDQEGAQRVDQFTGLGFVTPMCIKWYIRRYVEMLKAGEEGFKNYMALPTLEDGITLNDRDEAILADVDAAVKQKPILGKNNALIDEKIRDFACAKYFDVRAFGAVMTTFSKNPYNCSQIRGPVQILTGRSIDPIEEVCVTVSRRIVTKKDDLAKKQQDLGRQYMTPYALFRIDGYVNVADARNTGLSEDDLDVLWESIWNMFEENISATGGLRTVRQLAVFKYDSALGGGMRNSDIQKIIEVQKREGVDVPRSYDDYQVEVHAERLPSNVVLEHLYQ